MPSQNQYTVSNLLTKLYIVYNLHDCAEGCRIILPFAKFFEVMACEEDIEPVISYQRTAKEKYSMLQQFGFIDGQVLNIAKIKKHLRRE